MPASAPSPGPTPTREFLLEFQGTDWQLAALNGNKPMDGVVVTLSIVRGAYVAGYTGCSDYAFVYERSGNLIHVTLHEPQSYGCVVPGAAVQEAAYFEALASIAGYRVSADRLEFENASGETILAFAPWWRSAPDPALSGRLWLLYRLRGQPLVEGTYISTRFGYEPRATSSKNAITGYAGCGTLLGDLAVADAGVLLVNRLWPDYTKSPDEMCPGLVGGAEQQKRFIEALRSAASYRLRDGTLEIQDLSGETILVYVPQPEVDSSDSGLAGTGWQLVSIDSQEIGDGPPITLTFHDEQQGSGHAGCSDYLLHYSAHDGDLDDMGLAYLGYDCPPGEPWDRSAALFGRLPLVEHYRLGDGRLELITFSGETMSFEPLPQAADAGLGGSTWSLQAFLEPDDGPGSPGVHPVLPDVQYGTEISIHFEAGLASGLAGCNMYSAAYRRQGDALSFEPIGATGMTCYQQGIMEQEQRYFDFLQAVTSGYVYGDQLWLQAEDGRVLAFTMTGPSIVSELQRDSVFLQYEPEEQAGPAEASVPFGRVPEFTLLADGRVFYVERSDSLQPGQPRLLSARLTAAEVRDVMQQVMKKGLGRLDMWVCPCQEMGVGTSLCVAYEPGTPPLLRLRDPANGQLVQPALYNQPAQVPRAVHTLLTGYQHTAAQPYVPIEAALFVRPVAAADGQVVYLWPFDPAWLQPPDPDAEQWATVLAGDDLVEMMALVASNMGDFWFGHAGQVYETVLVPWLPGVNYADAVAAYRWP